MTLLEVLMCIVVALLLYIALCAGAMVGRLSPPAKRNSMKLRGQDILDDMPARAEPPPYGPVVVKDIND